MAQDSSFDLPHASISLNGKVALVSGATSGLGWRFARVLASVGATVAITGRRQENLAQLKSEILESGGQCQAYPLDMTDATAIEQVTQTISEELGTISVLVNNAGVPDAQLATKMSVGLIDRVLDTNVRGPFILAREIAKRLIAEKIPGRIVNIASMAAFDYDGNGAALYATSKGAIVRMTEALSVEWARFHINVNAIAPGVFYSEMTAGMFERVGDFSDQTRRLRFCYPAQLDSTLLYLCSPASECVTGTVIKVDDGQVNK